MPIKINKINLAEFSHSRTRNAAAKVAIGDILLFMVQDAVPIGNNFLEKLIKPFYDPHVACVFAKHIARSEANPVVRSEIERCFSSFKTNNNEYTIQDAKINVNDYLKRPKWYWFNSDVCSAIRKSVFDQIQFPDIPYAEDQIIGKLIIEAGWIKVYADTAQVIHSHQYSLINYFKRYFDESRGLKICGLWYRIGFFDFFPRIILNFIRDAKTLFKNQERLYWYIYAFLYHIIRISGYLLGQYFSLFPKNIQEKLSLEKKAYSRNGKLLKSGKEIE